jgi:hypothetical protein
LDESARLESINLSAVHSSRSVRASAATAAARPKRVEGKDAVRGASGRRRLETRRREQSQMKPLCLGFFVCAFVWVERERG